MDLVRVATIIGIAWGCSGCRQLFGIGEPLLVDAVGDDATVSDVAPDVGVDAPACFGAGLATICLAQLPTDPLVAPAAIDTDTSPLCTQPITPGAFCVVVATDITITTTLAATGSLPLVLLATGSLMMSNTGRIDVASMRSGGVVGAGADPAMCSAGTRPANGGGGAGGSFGSTGGDGGDSPIANTGGIAGATIAAATIHGGCAGQDAAGAMGSGGHGGGAVYLIAGASITVQGVIDASGESGLGGVNQSTGGGGAGGGGLIGFDAPAIDLTNSTIFANGAGGGGGGGSTAGGHDGAEPNAASATMPAFGGQHGGGGGGGGEGGFGAAGTLTAGSGASGPNGGGGGGGGGGGVIKIYGQVTGGTLSPPAS